MNCLTRYLTCLLFCAAPACAQDQSEGIAFFEKRIRPVLVEHCYKCHAADAKNVRGGLLLDSRAATLRGGDSGPAVVPGQVDDSLLIEAIRYDGYEMPPSGKLPDAVIADFEKWVAMGAPDPRTAEKHSTASDSGIDIEKGREFWSFRPLAAVDPPQTDSAWPRSQIDRFVLNKLQQAGLTPAPDADRRTLLRRAYFDLIGLPPSPEQLKAFLEDTSENAFERVVDQLLRSRHFGERWGRHWLDVARYADSTGGGRSAIFGTSWRYRNYVIESFNLDVPFNDFIVEQIAGDLLSAQDVRTRRRQLTATGFLAMGPTNYELQDKKQLRMDVVDEQIDTIGRAFLGMTIGCARCHDHKFDPIPTRDYYALAGIFRSTRSLIDGNVSKWVTRPLPATSDDAPDETRTALAAAEDRLKQLQAKADKVRKQLLITTIDNPDALRVGMWTESTSITGYVGKNYIHSKEPGARVVYRFDNVPAGEHEVLVSHTPGSNRERRTPVSIRTGSASPSLFYVNQKEAPTIDTQFVSLTTVKLPEPATVEVAISTEGTSEVVIADAVRLIGARTTEDRKLQEDLRAIEEAIRATETERDQLRKVIQDAEVVMSVEDEKNPEDFFVCIRGNVRRFGNPVPRGFLSVIDTQPASIPDGTSGRLQFARWIARDQNPLTSRVIVNRIWQHLFGTGLVRTVDNFGIPGERPSHPQLLDFLARDFVGNGWSVKKQIRAIVLSRTYQLSSHSSPSARKLDPENRLLSHQNRRRLEAEALRDAILTVSGQLDLSVAADSVRPGTNSEYGYTFRSNRRSVYLPVFRNRLHDLLAVFDFPDPNLAAGRRNVSTLSTQALYLMNSPFILQHSHAAAERLCGLNDLSDSDRLRLLYELALSRPPTEAETRLVRDFLSDETLGDRTRRWARVCQAVLGSVDFRYVR